MNKPSGSQITLPRMILYISAAAAVLLLIITGFIFQRRSSSSSLDESWQQLETNFATRQSLEEDQLEELQDSLEAVEREIQQLEDSLLHPGPPLPSSPGVKRWQPSTAWKSDRFCARKPFGNPHLKATWS